MEPIATTGLVLGKFYPPHKGHHYLIDVARKCVTRLCVVVEKMPDETIPVKLRANWLQSLFPDIEVLILLDKNPQCPSETPHFWSIWQTSLKRLLPCSIDYVFASETYGQALAECLNGHFLPVDPNRVRYPISGTRVRANPYRQWNYLTQPVQQYFQKRICICGPESTGKTTLVQYLAKTLSEQYQLSVDVVPEYARTYLDSGQTLNSSSDIERIAMGQWACELSASMAAVQLIDTGVFASRVWSEFLYSEVSEQLCELAQQSRYDLYLLCRPDLVWVDDGCRFLPGQSNSFFDRLNSLIQGNCITIEGEGEQRQEQALNACVDFLGLQGCK